MNFATRLERLPTHAEWIEGLRPPLELTLSEWSERKMVLSGEYSASRGAYHPFPYQVGMEDAMTDPRNQRVAVMKSARVGFSQSLNNAVGYYIDHEPSPILLVQPRESDAEDHSKRWIAPMLRDVPALAAVTGNPKSRDTSQTILSKQFLTGASLKLIGADSPAGFRRITVRVVLFDEVDGYAVQGAGAEGDQISLGIKRSETFWNRVVVIGSTPTIKGESRIEKEWLASDMRKYFVPCPHCSTYQALEWGDEHSVQGIKWRRDENGRHIDGSAYYGCTNGCVIEEHHKEEMVRRGEWRATADFHGYAGFHIWAGYSLFPNAGWSRLVTEWLRVHKDPLQRQTFVNTVLGLPYEDKGDHPLAEGKLLARCEKWAGEVPEQVGLLTAGVDFQADRLEVHVVGWGENEESWSIAYDVIEGDPESATLWDELDRYLLKTFARADGRALEIAASCLDSGGQEGHAQRVYEFSKARLGRRAWAIKGEAARMGQRSPVWPTKRPLRRTKASFRPVILGVNTAKDVIRTRLHIEQPGPGYMHFPAERDLAFFSQLIAERSVRKEAHGQRFRVWELPPGRANEALDTTVYAYAALCGLLHMGLKLNSRVAGVRSGRVELPIASAPPAPAAGLTSEPKSGAAAPTPGPTVTVEKRKKSLGARLAR
jgi:phage terminase large subunit GpA-like protein